MRKRHWCLPSCSGIPALTTYDVAAGAPGYAVLASRAIGVRCGGAAVGPPGVVEAVVRACAARRAAAAGDEVEGGSDYASDCEGGGEDGIEDEHDGNR